MNESYPFLIRGAASPDFVDYVSRQIDANPGRFESNTVDPRRRRFWTLKDGYDPVLAAKKPELTERFGIREWITDPHLHDLIGCISEGGFVHPHKDPADPNRMHVRINLLIQVPESGCIPLLDDIPIDPGEGDAWLCFSSHSMHATTPVVGKKERRFISYGLQVEQTAAFDLFSRYLSWRAANAHRA